MGVEQLWKLAKDSYRKVCLAFKPQNTRWESQGAVEHCIEQVGHEAAVKSAADGWRHLFEARPIKGHVNRYTMPSLITSNPAH